MTAVQTRALEAWKQVSATRDTPIARDLALLGARIGLAWLFIYHGARTLFGAFGGPGVHQASMFFGNVAHLHPATFFAALSGIIEFFGGIGVGLGILGRLAAAGLVGDMVIAMVTVTFGDGIASNSVNLSRGGGYELNIALAGLAFVVAVLGTGRFSLDEVIKAFVSRSSTSQSPPVDARR